jgi:hypothetical protein
VKATETQGKNERRFTAHSFSVQAFPEHLLCARIRMFCVEKAKGRSF